MLVHGLCQHGFRPPNTMQCSKEGLMGKVIPHDVRVQHLQSVVAHGYGVVHMQCIPVCTVPVDLAAGMQCTMKLTKYMQKA